MVLWFQCDVNRFSHISCHAFQCKRLEEQGHESFLVTVSSAGHLVMGTEKGQKFLEERMGLIEEFIYFCMGKKWFYSDSGHIKFGLYMLPCSMHCI